MIPMREPTPPRVFFNERVTVERWFLWLLVANAALSSIGLMLRILVAVLR